MPEPFSQEGTWREFYNWLTQGGTTSPASTGPALSATIATQRSGTATLSNVNDTASSTSLLASNAAREGATFYNDSTVDLYLKFGATASTTSFTVKIAPQGYFSLTAPIYTGAIDGIWTSDASGAVRITELSG